jgi:SAM-dependent methyltransferase
VKPDPMVLFPRRQALAAAAVLLLPCLARAQDTENVPARPLDVPYVPTPLPVVRKMLQLAQVGPQDMLYDLGCGDGRIVVAAAKDHGARGVGVDLNPQRIAEARAHAQAEGVEGRTRFLVGDLFETDLSEATVVTLYLLPDVNQRLRPQLWRQLRAGTRVVSHQFDMGPQWPPERSERVANAVVHQWTITARHKAA